MNEFASRAELLRAGYTPRGLTRAVRAGTLVRARRDHYLPPDCPDAVVRAVRVGGRLTCLSLLALWEVFVLRVHQLHVHVERNASRLRSSHDRRRRLRTGPAAGVRVHYLPLSAHPGRSACVDIVDALAHAVLCQPARAAVATLDSAVHLGLITTWQLADVFSLIPAKYAVIKALVDGRAESGTETLVRLMVRGLGHSVELQVKIPGVGRVDMVVDGWLVIECDSEKYHGTWADHERDRRRDAILASLGYPSLRLPAKIIMYEPELALAAIRGALGFRATDT